MTYPNEGAGNSTPPPDPNQNASPGWGQPVPPTPQQGYDQPVPSQPAPSQPVPAYYQPPHQTNHQPIPDTTPSQQPPCFPGPLRGVGAPVFPTSGKGVPVWATILIGVCAALVSAGIVTGIFLSLSFHKSTLMGVISEERYHAPGEVAPDLTTPSVKSYSGLTPGSYYLEAQQGTPGSYEISLGNKVKEKGEVGDSAWISIAEGEVLTLTDLTMKAPEGMDPREYPEDYAGPNPPSASSEEEQEPTAYQAGVDFTAGEVLFVVLNNEHAGRLTIYDSLEKDPVAVYTFYGSRSFTLKEGQYVTLENLSPPR